jgi:TPR repeat protein
MKVIQYLLLYLFPILAVFNALWGQEMINESETTPLSEQEILHRTDPELPIHSEGQVKTMEEIQEDLGDIENETPLTEIEKLLELAEKGDSNAQHTLGILYLSGTLVEKDNNAALQWIQRAAQSEHPIATYNLGVIYLRNAKKQENLKQALFWLKKSSDLGNANAALVLAKIFNNNKKAPFNSVHSYYWLEKAHDMGMEQVSPILSKLYTDSSRSSGFRWIEPSKKPEIQKSEEFTNK